MPESVLGAVGGSPGPACKRHYESALECCLWKAVTLLWEELPNGLAIGQVKLHSSQKQRSISKTVNLSILGLDCAYLLSKQTVLMYFRKLEACSALSQSFDEWQFKSSKAAEFEAFNDSTASNIYCKSCAINERHRNAFKNPSNFNCQVPST